MKSPIHKLRQGFTLIETVIAIGVLAVLLSGFLIVFAPAAAGIKKSINSQTAAWLVTTLEEELVTLRGSSQQQSFGTGFNKSFYHIRASGISNSDFALMLYNYRASLTEPEREDDTLRPVENLDSNGDGEPDLVPGEDYIVQSMMRRKREAEFLNDLPAIEGSLYLVICTQLIMGDSGNLELGQVGQLFNADDVPRVDIKNPDDYEHAVITFVADFYAVPAKNEAAITRLFNDVMDPTKNVTPLFSRNLAVRR